MIIECVPTTLVDKAWHHVAPHLSAAIAKTGNHTTPAQLWQECMTGFRNLLLFIEDGDVKIGAIVTFETWDGESVAHLNLACGGSSKLWVDNLPLLSEWCKEHGATSIVLAGQGDIYGRILKKENIKRVYTTYRMEI